MTSLQFLYRLLLPMISAAVISALAVTAAQAEKVTVKIVPRPAQAAAVTGWSPQLNTDVAAALTGKALAAGVTNATWTGRNFAKHHIIPQTYLQAAAGLALLNTVGDQSLRDRLVAAIRTISAGAAGGPPAAWNLGPVVWAPINLFEGPDGFYRSDDPGEGGEKTRPRSFDQTRWTLLQTALKSLENAGKMTAQAYTSSTDYLNKMQKGGKTGFGIIVEAFEGLANFQGGQAGVSAFARTDWVDNSSNTFVVADLIVYLNSQVVAQLSGAKKNAYHLR
ncbi:hypothetical protein WNZ14_19605 [Hoeflea sp. AS60]|uniref:hypothetical protein n=1 Tax=Hoeflea sp. AS60 TaxID=3135780 RepID=UPI003181B93F